MNSSNITSDIDPLHYPLSSRNKLDRKLVAQATRLVIAFGISLALLISAVVAGYVVLREQMVTQKYLAEANRHINVIHRTLSESVSLLQDFRDKSEETPPNLRLIQIIRRNINSTIDELDTQANLLTTTMAKLEGTPDWDDFKWITSSGEGSREVLLQAYLNQMHRLVEQDAGSEHHIMRPTIPAEAAGARNGSLSNGFRKASEQVSENIALNSSHIEEIHERLTLLILGMFFLMCFLIVLPLWQRLIREHKRHQSAHDKLHQFAYTDQETYLPNLDGFEQYILNKAISTDAVHKHYLILVRIKNLYEIGNLIGSQRTTQMHLDFSARLMSSQLSKLSWSRSSDSEYATVITQKRLNNADEWVEKFYNELTKPINVSGVLVCPVIAMAVSKLEEQEIKEFSLLREHQANARMALSYFDRTKCKLPAYNATLANELTKQNELITAITHGVENREFVPFYQIRVDAATGNPSSMEVVCRWEKAGKEVAGPQTFILAAEKSGQIVPLTYQLVEHVVNDVEQLAKKGLGIGSVAINVSIDVLQHKDFVARICEARKLLLACQSDLEIEITENVVIEDSAGVILLILQQLRKQGVRITIDDFGTGYASLQTLIDLPFDVIKVDRSFVVTMTETEVGNEVLSTMILLGSKLGKRSVVEGVEFSWQRDALVKMGADELQGNLFHKPAGARDVADCLTNVKRNMYSPEVKSEAVSPR